MRGWLNELGLVAAIFLFAVLVDQIAWLKQLDSYLRTHPQPWLGLTVGAAAVGLALLLFVWISWFILQSRPMTQDEAQATMRSTQGPFGASRFLRGKAVGITTPDGEASFHAIKEAFYTGAWLTDPLMRVFCLGTVGLMLLLLGAFGYFAVVGPPAVKVIGAATVVYALGRTAWGFVKA